MSKKTKIIMVVAIVLIIVLGVVTFLFLGRDKDKELSEDEYWKEIGDNLPDVGLLVDENSDAEPVVSTGEGSIEDAGHEATYVDTTNVEPDTGSSYNYTSEGEFPNDITKTPGYKEYAASEYFVEFEEDQWVREGKSQTGRTWNDNYYVEAYYIDDASDCSIHVYQRPFENGDMYIAVYGDGFYD